MNAIALKEAAKFLHTWLGFQSRQTGLPGFSVAVYLDGRMVFAQAYGMADVAMGIPMSTSHLFGVGSQTKMFTATAILQLVAKDLVHLNAPIEQYLPWLTNHKESRFRTVTVRQLLTHSSGLIRDTSRSDYWQGKMAFPTTAALRKAVSISRFVSSTNSAMKYSNLGFALLGRIVESVSGQTYSSYVSQHIAKPLDLKAWSPDWRWALTEKTATGYAALFDNERTPTLNVPMRALAPVAGSLASPSDMCRFVSGHFYGNPILLNDSLKSLAHKAHCIVSEGYDKGYEYGMGFEVIEVAGRRLLGHGGSLVGYRSATFFDPKTKLAVSVAANCKDAPALSMVRGIFEALFHFQDASAPKVSSDLTRFNALLHSNLATTQIVATGNSIVAIDPNDWEPFAWAERLVQIDTQSLVVAEKGSVHEEGERLDFSFKDEAPMQVTYAGLSLDAVPAQPQARPNESDEQFTLPVEPAEVLFLHYLRRSQNAFFRLQLLPDYDIDQDDAADSLRAWLQGKTNKSIALLEKLKSQDAERPPWLRVWPADLKNKGGAFRILVVDGDFSPYMQWGLEHFKRINIPLCGEKIFYLPKRYLEHQLLPTGDVIMCNHHVVVNRYKGNTLTHRTFYNARHKEALRFVDLQKQVVQLAKQHHLRVNW